MNCKIFLDLDDTLFDTSGEIARRYFMDGYKLNDKSFLMKNPLKSLAVWSDIKKNHGFWEELPLLNWAEETYDLAMQIAGNEKNVSVLTALPPIFLRGETMFEKATRAKVRLVEKHFPKLKENVIVCYAKEKKNFVKKGIFSVLVDDSHKNVTAWETAGGCGVLVEPSGIHIEKMKKLKK